MKPEEEAMSEMAISPSLVLVLILLTREEKHGRKLNSGGGAAQVTGRGAHFSPSFLPVNFLNLVLPSTPFPKTALEPESRVQGLPITLVNLNL